MIFGDVRFTKKHIFLDRKNGRLALYLRGDLQFDANDERLYHEPLSWLPVALMRERNLGKPLTIVILGGGDGLALREVLKFSEVQTVYLVERDSSILSLGKTELAELNQHAFEDKRVQIRAMEARDFPSKNDASVLADVIIFDLTYPKDLSDSLLFTVDFISSLKKYLAPKGILSMNAVSPQKTPKAFECLGVTLQATGLIPLPWSNSIPSFAKEGFGRWGFFMASEVPVAVEELKKLKLPSGSSLKGIDFNEMTQVPLNAHDYIRAKVNRGYGHELLYYISNDTPIPWTEPFGPLVMESNREVASQKLTMSDRFALWLENSKGEHSLENLVKLIPTKTREATLYSVKELSLYAETLSHQKHVNGFISQLLKKAKEIPQEWSKEIHEITQAAQQGELNPSSPVFSIFIFMLLYVHFFFSDNYYAKGITPYD